MNLSAFLKFLPIYMSYINIDGIKFIDTKKTDEIKFRGEKILVPVFKIDNTKNIPFSFNSLTDLVSVELESLDEITSANIGNAYRHLLVKFDDFYKNSYYMPENLSIEFENCVDGFTADVNFKIRHELYIINFTFILDNYFAYYWEDYESFRIEISVMVNSINVYDSKNNKNYLVDEDKIRHVINDLDDYDMFENALWECVVKNFLQHRTFLNPEWQYVSFSFYQKL